MTTLASLTPTVSRRRSRMDSEAPPVDRRAWCAHCRGRIVILVRDRDQVPELWRQLGAGSNHCPAAPQGVHIPEETP